MHHFALILGLTGAYFLVILGFVVYARFKSTRSLLPGLNEFFLAGKNLSPLVLTCTLIGSLMSTFSVLGLPALVYTHGIGGVGFLLLAVMLSVVVLLFFGKKIRRCAEGERIFSPVEVISQGYGSRKLGLFISIIFIIFLMPYISLQLVGVGAFIEAYTGGEITYFTGVGSMMAVVLLYLFIGGMRAVAYTDFIQFMAIMVGLVFGLFFFFHHFDLSVLSVIEGLKEKSPAHLSLPGPKGFYAWPMFISSAIIITGVFFQPHIMTRFLMAKDDFQINFMAVGTVIGFVILSVLALFWGWSIHLSYGADLKPNYVMGHVFQELGTLGLLGVLIAGLMLMGVLGAAMSTADSLLISIGQVSTRDVLRPFIQMSPRRQVIISKIIMFFVLAGAFFIGLEPPQFMTDLAMYSAAGCALLIPTIICFSWEKRSLLASYLSIVVGLALLVIMVSYKMKTGISYGDVHPGMIPMALSFITYFGVSLFRFHRVKR